MKLKKIASLMLAGVMAVSMLAGCNTTSTDPEQPTDPETPTATGYSDVLAENLSDDAKKDYIAFEDNADDLAALEDALGNMSWTTTAGNTALPKVIAAVHDWDAVDTSLVVKDFIDGAGLKENQLVYNDMWNALLNNRLEDDETVKYGLLYVIDGTVREDKALKQVANRVENLLENLPNVNVSVTARYPFDYTVSVSVATQPLDVFEWYNGAAEFLAVTVTRVPTAA